MGSGREGPRRADLCALRRPAQRRAAGLRERQPRDAARARRRASPPPRGGPSPRVPGDQGRAVRRLPAAGFVRRRHRRRRRPRHRVRRGDARGGRAGRRADGRLPQLLRRAARRARGASGSSRRTWPGTKSRWRRSGSTRRVAIRRPIRQPMAGGEILFGVAGFAPLRRRARSTSSCPTSSTAAGCSS